MFCPLQVSVLNMTGAVCRLFFPLRPAGRRSIRKDKIMNIQTSTSDIRIYVACLASYNNGILHGAWIDADQSEDEIWDAIKDIFASSPIPDAEEHAIHDYEGFYRVRIEECSNIKTVAALGEFISEHGEHGAELISHYGDLEEARTALSERYAGPFYSLKDFARFITEDTNEVPQHLMFYIDYEKMARDLEISDVIAIELEHDEVHVFWQR